MANENLKVLRRIVEQVKEPGPRLDSVEKRLLALQDIVKLLDSQVSKDDFADAFAAVLGYVNDFKDETVKEMRQFTAKAETIYTDLKALSDTDRRNLTTQIEQAVQSQIEAVNEMLVTVDKRLSEVKDGKDGESPDEDGIIDSVLRKIPPPPVLSRENIRDWLESFEGEERLKQSAIDGLEDALEEIKKAKSKGTFGGGMSQPLADGRYTQYHGGAANIYVSATEPANPQLYDLWLDVS